MCGIAGYVQRIDSPHRPIEKMTSRVAHRGPDGEGYWTANRGDWHIALGHRRLAIIDLKSGGQPLSNETSSRWITFNGEIFNYRELQADLEQRGHRFATHSDTEAIVHCVEEHGTGALPMLNGMFAFGLWDQANGRLLLARDRVGIKPLFYAPLRDGGLAFASELTALLAHPAVDASIDPAALAQYFFTDYVAPPLTMVRGARKLQPGHCLEWNDGATGDQRPYWSVWEKPDQQSNPPRDITTSAQAVRTLLTQAVQRQMISDVPIGIFLSGGIDSSVVAATAQQNCDRQLQTFSIAFEDPQYDESAFARLVATQIKSQHVEKVCSENDLIQSLDDALACLDEPIADSSILPTYLLSRLAADHVKVVLGGDGGDELWGGYPTYRAHRHARRYAQIPHVLRRRFIDPIVARLPVRHGYQSFEWKAKRFALRWDDDLVRRHFRWMSNIDLRELHAILAHPSITMPSITDRDDDSLNDILKLDFTNYLPGSVLTKVDRASMACGLEVRPPLLDNDLIDAAFAMPSSLKLFRGQSKAILKQAARGLIPDAIIDRRKKGFAIPLARWLAGPLRDRVDGILASSPLWQTGLLHQQTIARWSQEQRDHVYDRSRALWAMIVLDDWYRRISAK